MRSRVRATLAIALVLAPLSILAAACSSAPPEQQLLNQFFRAARTRDNETLARMSAVEFSPRAQGEVTDFEITNMSEERRTPLTYKQLIDAQNRAAGRRNGVPPASRQFRVGQSAGARSHRQAGARSGRQVHPRAAEAEGGMGSVSPGRSGQTKGHSQRQGGAQ